MDLDSQVNTLSLKVHSNMVQRAAKDWRTSARTRPRKEPLGVPDYKNIIEKLQVKSFYITMILHSLAAQRRHKATAELKALYKCQLANVLAMTLVK